MSSEKLNEKGFIDDKIKIKDKEFHIFIKKMK